MVSSNRKGAAESVYIINEDFSKVEEGKKVNNQSKTKVKDFYRYFFFIPGGRP